MTPTTTSEQHDWFRIAQAARDLSNPDITDRQRRSAAISFYRAFRSLADHTDDRNLRRATIQLGAYTMEVSK